MPTVSEVADATRPRQLTGKESGTRRSAISDQLLKQSSNSVCSAEHDETTGMPSAVHETGSPSAHASSASYSAEHAVVSTVSQPSTHSDWLGGLLSQSAACMAMQTRTHRPAAPSPS